MLNQSVKENIGAASMRDDMKFGLINVRVQIGKIKHFIEKLGIICSSIYQLVENLSGGNQQKVLLAVSDRIIVMHEGRVTGLFSQEEASKEKLMHAMTG